MGSSSGFPRPPFQIVTSSIEIQETVNSVLFNMSVLVNSESLYHFIQKKKMQL